MRDSQTAWSFGKRLLFCITSTYFFLYVFPFPLNYIPYTDVIFGYYEKALGMLSIWVGRYILDLHYPFSVEANGSGDTTHLYIVNLTFLIGALLIGFVWTLADLKRKSYDRQFVWMINGLSYYLGLVMLSYGFSKVFLLQFSSPWLFRYVEIYGNFSPMGVMWNFMDHSASYTIFGGLGEVVGGLLLFVRRTRLCGAIVLIGVMTNVVLLNFSYDIPVKLFSSNLLLMAITIAVANREKLLKIFHLKDNLGETKNVVGETVGSKTSKAILVFKSLLILYLISYEIADSLKPYNEWGPTAEKPKYFGLYNVRKFVLNNEERPPLTTDSLRWRNVTIEKVNRFGIRRMDDSIALHSYSIDTISKSFIVYPKHRTDSMLFEYQFNQLDSSLRLNGAYHSDSILMELELVDVDNFLVRRRGFNWINEEPFNR